MLEYGLFSLCSYHVFVLNVAVQAFIAGIISFDKKLCCSKGTFHQ